MATFSRHYKDQLVSAFVDKVSRDVGLLPDEKLDDPAFAESLPSLLEEFCMKLRVKVLEHTYRDTVLFIQRNRK